MLKHGAILVTDAKDIINSFEELHYDMQKDAYAINENSIPKKYIEIYKLIRTQKMGVNEICRNLKKSINEVNSILFLMELEDYIRKSATGDYEIIGE